MAVDPNYIPPRAEEKEKKNSFSLGKIFLILLIVILGLIGFVAGIQLTQKTLNGCYIDSKELRPDGDMLVTSENCGNMKVELDPLIGEASSKGVFESIEVGQVYNLRVAGIPVDVLSLSANILSAELVPAPPAQ